MGGCEPRLQLTGEELGRFWAKVNRDGPVPIDWRGRPDDPARLMPCWMWTAATYESGHGMFGVRNACGEPALSRAHRITYRMLVGPIPRDLVPDHLCHTPACVNPLHLELVPQRTNVLRGDSFMAERARQTHCEPRGHPLSGANVYIHPKRGTRHCRACAAERKAAGRLKVA